MKNTALITGASGGIGLELARVHASRGGDLVLVARNAKRLEEAKVELQIRLGVQVMTLPLDLSLPDSARQLHDWTKEQGVEIDILVNNAGFGDYGPFADADAEKLSQMIALNVMALTSLTRLFAHDMATRKQGRILNVASMAAFFPGPYMAVYYATKAYVLHLTEAVGSELSGTGVTLTALCPGPTDTGFEQAADTGGNRLFDERKLSSAAQVARCGYKAMLRGRAVAIPGAKNNLLALSARFLPRAWTVSLVRSLQRERP